MFENKEAKASQGGTTENELKYSILGLIIKICFSKSLIAFLELEDISKPFGCLSQAEG